LEESASTEIVGHVALGRFGGFEHDRELLGLFLSSTVSTSHRKGSPLTEQGKITERFHRINYGHMEVRVTVTDPKAYTHPFTVTLNEYLEPASELMDFVCLENDSSGPQFLGK